MEEMTIKEISKQIDLVIAGKVKKEDYDRIYYSLNGILTRKISFSEIELISKTIYKIAITKNRILRHLEKDFWAFIIRVPSKIISLHYNDIENNIYIETEEYEELLPNTDYKNENKNILSHLIRLSYRILTLKGDKSNGCDLRRSGSINLIDEINCYFQIP